MSDLQTYKIPVKVGNAMSIYSEMVGTFTGKVPQKNKDNKYYFKRCIIHPRFMYKSIFIN